MEDMHSAYKTKDVAPFFDAGEEVIPWKCISETRLELEELAAYLEATAAGRTAVLVVSCSKEDMKGAEEIIKAHNAKDGVAKVKQCWATAADMYQGGSTYDKDPKVVCPWPKKIHHRMKRVVQGKAPSYNGVGSLFTLAIDGSRVTRWCSDNNSCDATGTMSERGWLQLKQSSMASTQTWTCQLSHDMKIGDLFELSKLFTALGFVAMDDQIFEYEIEAIEE
jgi:hypothetical protein